MQPQHAFRLLSVGILLFFAFIMGFISHPEFKLDPFPPEPTDALEHFSTRTVTVAPYEWQQVVGRGFLDGGLFEGHSVEVQIARIFVYTLTRTNPHNGLVFDVGMNTGLYTCLAATAGFTVHSFEPQPMCHRLMNYMIWKNGFGSRVHLHLAGAGLENGLIKQNSDVCDSGNMATDASEGAHFHQIPIQRISLLLNHRNTQPILLMKMDTEGFEINILRDLLPLFEEGRIHNLIVEIVPCVWKEKGHDVRAGVDVLTKLQAIARRTLVLSDPNPPHLGVAHIDVDFNNEIPGPFYSVDDMSTFLLQDRLPPRSGCNAWFTFV